MSTTTQLLFRTTRFGLPNFTQFLIPLVKILNLMKGSNFLELFSKYSILTEFFFFWPASCCLPSASDNLPYYRDDHISIYLLIKVAWQKINKSDMLGHPSEPINRSIPSLHLPLLNLFSVPLLATLAQTNTIPKFNLWFFSLEPFLEEFRSFFFLQPIWPQPVRK